jgi:hypothetical protein
MVDDIKIVPESELKITEAVNIEALRIASVQTVAPIAAHIKEVNHIDPISIDALYVSEVRNIEPIAIERFNVTNLPMVNVSLRQIPPVDFNVRRVPPLSIGTHQDFSIPSSYTVRARFLGFEFLRIHLDGQTAVVPKERARREQLRTVNQSFPETAVAGNPAIPSIHRETSSQVSYPAHAARSAPRRHVPGPAARPSRQGGARPRSAGSSVRPPEPAPAPVMSYGMPRLQFAIPQGAANAPEQHSRVRSGE